MRRPRRGDEPSIADVGRWEQHGVQPPFADPTREHLADREAAQEPRGNPFPPAGGAQGKLAAEQRQREPGAELPEDETAVRVPVEEGTGEVDDGRDQACHRAHAQDASEDVGRKRGDGKLERHHALERG